MYPCLHLYVTSSSGRCLPMPLVLLQFELTIEFDTFGGHGQGFGSKPLPLSPLAAHEPSVIIQMQMY